MDGEYRSKGDIEARTEAWEPVCSQQPAAGTSAAPGLSLLRRKGGRVGQWLRAEALASGCPFLALCPWATLSLGFFICKMGVMEIQLPHGAVLGIK